MTAARAALMGAAMALGMPALWAADPDTAPAADAPSGSFPAASAAVQSLRALDEHVAGLTRQVDTLTRDKAELMSQREADRQKAAFQIQALESHADKLSRQIESLGKDKAGLAAQLSQTSDELARVRSQLGQAEVTRQSLEERVAQLAKDAERQGLESARASQQAAHTSDELLRVKNQHEQLLAQHGLLQAKVSQLEQDASARDQELLGLRTQLAGTGEALAAARTEIDQLKLVRNDNEALKRTLAKTDAELLGVADDRARLRDEVAALKKQVGTEARLRKDIESLTSSIAQRDEQLQKIRDINAAYDRQFAEAEASQHQLEARLRQSEQERDAAQRQLADTQQALKAGAERSRKELASLQEQFQAQLAETTKELDEVSARHQQTVRELEALHSTQLSLQERLVAAREKNVSLDASLTGLQESKVTMDKLVKPRDTDMNLLRGELDKTQEALRLSEKELLDTKQLLADAQADRANLQQQVRVAKDTQITFSDQLKDLQAIQAERDKLQFALNDRETRVTKLQGEIASLGRDLETTKRQLQVLQAEGSEQIEQTKIDQKGYEWRVETLERELEEARDSETKARAELEQNTRKLGELESFKQHLAQKLQQRESELSQAETTVRLLQGHPPVTAVSAPGITVSGSEDEAPTETPVARFELEPALEPVQEPRADVPPAIPATLGAEYPVKVYQVNDEFHFVVFSMEDEDTAWAKHGTQLLLVSQDEPVAAVELTELDSAGFAVAQVIQTIDPGRQLRKGDLLLARPLAHPIGQ